MRPSKLSAALTAGLALTACTEPGKLDVHEAPNANLSGVIDQVRLGFDQVVEPHQHIGISKPPAQSENLPTNKPKPAPIPQKAIENHALRLLERRDFIGRRLS